LFYFSRGYNKNKTKIKLFYFSFILVVATAVVKYANEPKTVLQLF